MIPKAVEEGGTLFAARMCNTGPSLGEGKKASLRFRTLEAMAGILNSQNRVKFQEYVIPFVYPLRASA